MPIAHGERLLTPISRSSQVLLPWSSYIYPRSSHLYYGPMLEREAMKRNLDWFTRWIKPAS